MVETVRETESYRYDIDRIYGTGWFVRKSDDFVQTYLDTGGDVVTAKAYYPSISNDRFNGLAEKETYSPRWEED